MLAKSLRIGLLIELMLWGVLAWRLTDVHGVRPLGSVALALLAAVGWRVVLHIIAFAVAWIVGRRRPASGRVGAFGRIGAVLRETWVFSVLFAWYQLWPGRYGKDALTVARDEPAHEKSPIVLLVHGYCCNAGVWCWYLRWLEQAGFRVYTVSLEPLFGDLDDLSKVLEGRIAAIAAHEKGAKVSLVCHSMGGLVARGLLQHAGPSAVDKVITLGTPHRGTFLALLGLGENGRQMRPGSAWLNDGIGVASLLELGERATAMLTCDDNIVMPQANATLPGVRTVEFAGLGHLSLLRSRRVFDRVLEVLRA